MGVRVRVRVRVRVPRVTHDTVRWLRRRSRHDLSRLPPVMIHRGFAPRLGSPVFAIVFFLLSRASRSALPSVAVPCHTFTPLFRTTRPRVLQHGRVWRRRRRRSRADRFRGDQTHRGGPVLARAFALAAVPTLDDVRLERDRSRATLHLEEEGARVAENVRAVVGPSPEGSRLSRTPEEIRVSL